jgi:hypothetical protein
MPPSYAHLLTPYLNPPQYSLTVLTSVIGATSNWLVLRYLYAALAPLPKDAEGGIGSVPQRQKVVLVSFMRGWAFWRAEARRLVSILVYFIYSYAVPWCLIIFGCCLCFYCYCYILVQLLRVPSKCPRTPLLDPTNFWLQISLAMRG